MVMALGVGAWTGGVFHLFTHAYFKACLFLGAGSVSHAAHHTFDMREMGGLRKYQKKTFACFTIAMLALVGIPPFAGFWSKDEILAGAAQGQHGGAYWLMLVFGLMTAFMTAAYMIRAWWMTFFGEYRGHGTPHESPAVMTVPLMILAAMSVVVGLVNIPYGSLNKFEQYVQPSYLFPHVAGISFNWYTAIASVGLGVLGGGAVLPVLGPAQGPVPAASPSGSAPWPGCIGPWRTSTASTCSTPTGSPATVKGSMAAASYWFNQHVIDAVPNGAGKAAVASGRVLYRDFDQQVLDGVIVASGSGAEATGQALSHIQTGKVQQYAALLFAGAALLAVIFVFAT